MFEVGAFSWLLSRVLVNSGLLVVIGDLSHLVREFVSTISVMEKTKNKLLNKQKNSEILWEVLCHLSDLALAWID